MSAAPFHVVIPARLGSTRLPRKVLRLLRGKPIIQWVWEAVQASGATSLHIAADSAQVASVCRDFGADVVMTDPALQSGTDRANAVAGHLAWPDAAVVVNVQGDEPLMPSALVAQCAQLLHHDVHADLATLAHAIHDEADYRNPNVVKVVASSAQRALYFSRAPIPWAREASIAAQGAACLPENLAYRHIGLYAYRVAALRRFSALPPSPLETCEALEQLRALQAGFAIALGYADQAPPRGVDTEADLIALETLLRDKIR